MVNINNPVMLFWSWPYRTQALVKRCMTTDNNNDNNVENLTRIITMIIILMIITIVE